MSDTIVLIGLSGSGKSTYGKKLSEQLNLPFYDIDQLIEQKEGISITQIFAEKGEIYFRELEWRIFNEYVVLENVIIATGGGLIPYAFHNAYNKPPSAKYIYLDTDITEIQKRLEVPSVLSERPLLANETNLAVKLAKLHKERSPAYLAWADTIIKNA